MKIKIKKNDNVMVISGKDRGRTGVVQKVLPKIGKVLVTGVNIAKHHLKPSKKNPHGGIIDMVAPVDSSNVLVMCPHCSKPVRVGFRVSGNVKERICRKCNGNLDAEKNVTSK